MRLTAAQKAIGELNMQKSDIARAQVYIEKGEDLARQLEDIDRCIDLLSAMSLDAVPKKTRKPRIGKRKLAGAAE